jgi:hypothetical protein
MEGEGDSCCPYRFGCCKRLDDRAGERVIWGHLVLGDHAKKAKAKVGESHDAALGLAHHRRDGYMGGSAASSDH